MVRSWQLQEAKNKLSQVIDEAQEEGPQVITRRGVEVVVVIAYEQYRRMVASREKLSDFFRHSPLSETNLDLSRDKSEIRDEIGL